MIPHIPRVGRRDARLGAGGQIPVQIIGLGGRAERELLVVRIVVRGGHRRRNIGPGKRAAGLDAIAHRIIRVRERPQRGGALFVRERRQFGGGVIRIRHAVRVRVRDTRSSVGIVVRERHRARPLDDGREPIGIIVGIDHLRLPDDGHRRSSTGIVIGIVHRPLRGHFLRQSIEPIIRSGNRGGDRATTVLFLHLRDPVAAIIGVVRTGPILERGFCASVQRIVGIGRRLILSIKHRGEVPVIVIGVGFGIEQRILSRGRPIHIVRGIHRLLALCIGHGEEIAVGVIPELGDSVDGIGQLRDAIQGIGRIDRLLAQGVDEAAEPSRGIKRTEMYRESFELSMIRLIMERYSP